MEENKGIEMGVEAEGVANLEPEAVTEPTEVTQDVAEETEVTEQTVAEPIESKFEKAFSKRLSKATEKIRAEEQSKYEPELAKYRRIIELGMKENGFETEQEYLEAVLGNYEQPNEAEKAPLDPEAMAILEELKEQRATKEIESEKAAYWDRQAKLLADVGVTDMSQIPEEVLEKALDNGTEIAYEYLKWDKQQAIQNAKKEVIREIQETETPGSLSGGGSDGAFDIASVSWDDPKFDELLKQVKSGERKRL